MNAQGNIDEAAGMTKNHLAASFAPLAPFMAKVAELDAAITGLVDAGDDATAGAARKLRQQLRSLEPSVTMIGQVKAGKTSLVNAMSGRPGLLPADVNPWTSVVTSLHFSPRPLPEGNRASFRFFDEAEWSRLVDRGGRIGELAARAGAEDEMEKVRRQLEAMREKSRQRLGRKFEMLLGQTHDYGYFDDDLIQRYVCLGDDFESETDTSYTQGRFADITRSADLFLHQPGMPLNLCIRDTPGVNDTFMIREQITIRSIRESRICVVVLSAHQALSTVDMALIRLIANVKSREVVIFVNRIDELSDPAAQVPEIRDSIRKTLKDHHGPTDAEIVFGSAYWANQALLGEVDELDEASAAALLNWADAELSGDEAQPSTEEMVWALSGIPALYRTLSERIEEGVGAEALSRLARSALNLAGSLSASDNIVTLRAGGRETPTMTPAQIAAEIDRIEAQRTASLAGQFRTAVADFETRLERSHASFLDRATGALLKHLDAYGENEVWQYDPTGLRVLLRTAYQVFARKADGLTSKALEEAAAEFRSLYSRAFGIAESDVAIAPPKPPQSPAPVLLGQTIALDLKGNWWSRWWRRRRSYTAYAAEFSELIKAETDPIVAGLRLEHAGSIESDASVVLREFLSSQRAILAGLAEQSALDIDDLRAQLGGDRQRQQDAVRAAMPVFTRFAA